MKALQIKKYGKIREGLAFENIDKPKIHPNIFCEEKGKKKKIRNRNSYQYAFCKCKCCFGIFVL